MCFSWLFFINCCIRTLWGRDTAGLAVMTAATDSRGLTDRWCAWLALVLVPTDSSLFLPLQPINASSFPVTRCVDVSDQSIKFGARKYGKIWGAMCLTVVTLSDCLDTVMDRFSGVQPISPTAIFRHWSRLGRYLMTTITVVWLVHSPYNYGSVGPGNACNQFVEAEEWRSCVFPLLQPMVDLCWRMLVSYITVLLSNYRISRASKSSGTSNVPETRFFQSIMLLVICVVRTGNECHKHLRLDVFAVFCHCGPALDLWLGDSQFISKLSATLGKLYSVYTHIASVPKWFNLAPAQPGPGR